MGDYLRNKQLREIHRLIPEIYATRAEAERALVDIGLSVVLKKNGLEPLPMGE